MEESVLRKSLSQTKSGVVFLNVAQSYIPNTKVECHYTLPPTMKWSASDWIGIFKVEACSVRDYYTFAWSMSPDGSGEGLPIHCSVQFHAYYLPRPGEQQYQFRYVDSHGGLRGQSSPFTFSEPLPMDDLVTLEADEAHMDMLLVVPKATVLQHQLEDSQQERNSLMRVKLQLEEEVGDLKNKIEQLEETLRTTKAEHGKLTEQYEDISASETAVREERDALSHQQADHVARILELEEDVQVFSEKVLEKEEELSRLKHKVASLELKKEKLNEQLKHESAEKEQYKHALEASEQESRKLCRELEDIKSRLREQDSQTHQLQEELGKLQDRLMAAQGGKLQVDALYEKLRSTQDQLSASQQKVVLLGEELASASSIRDRTISDLHKSRLETAEVNIKHADMTLKWKEGKGQWCKEKAALIQSMEVEKDKILKLSAEVLKLENSFQEEKSQMQKLRSERSRERDASLVQLSEGRRELKELRSALKVAQMEKEHFQEEKQVLQDYVKKLEERLEKVADEKWTEAAASEGIATATALASDSSLTTDSEDESPEDMRVHPYNLCDNRGATEQTAACQREPSQRVVISQPAPISSQRKQLLEDNSSDSEAEDEKAVMMAAAQSGGEETNLLLPELGAMYHSLVGDFVEKNDPEADSKQGGRPNSCMWKECPICKQRFPPQCDTNTLEQHVDSHFFFSTHEPFIFE
ncbi:calcium-binding and coiled-coil domain-containing protein 1 isoform X1 [Microcaecilia unicolor]|uniref:Calcium-binding and coiled-coil domain-containing protein 1 n=1 Tax=Microcaecilia unicolor TaxID=1415580 RepID=A0A6P7XLY8_9AMPH|nr:calcium-binding and coiled-coil domain-containing protein 1 isoform X1 [Microcaecilia unicolor]